jgi:uncharacterized iron-regulated membrane protein
LVEAEKSSWLRRYINDPQRLWLRRAAFQVHLWCGIGIGLYIVMLSLTGSLLVYRNELNRWLMTPRPQFDAKATRLTKEQLQAAAERAYPGYKAVRVSDRISRRNPTIEIALERGGDSKSRLFNPYTGEDLGDAVTRGELALIWIAHLHDELLFDFTGRFWNGVGSIIATVLVLTGLVVWWPGVKRWRRSLRVGFSAGWKGFNWDLHSAMGFWLFLFMLLWGVSGIYLGIPQPFTALVDAISDPNAIERPGDEVLLWLTRLHFGRWRNQTLKALWAVAGLAPALMFFTGVIMWWNRSLRPRWLQRQAIWLSANRR